MLDHHDIFISYRRDGGEHLAARVKAALAKRGFSVFMDIEDLKSGKFNIALYSKIEKAADFVVILTQGCLERCKNEDDWLRKEIKHAIRCKRNIVPVIGRGFNMPPPAELPSDIAELSDYNGLAPAHELFEASIEKLATTLLKSVPKPPQKNTVKRFALLVVALLIVIYVFTFFKWNESGMPRVSSIQGVILTEEHQPIANAEVELDRLPGKRVKSDSNGGFSFDDVPGAPGAPVQISVNAIGFQGIRLHGALMKAEPIVLKRERKK